MIRIDLPELFELGIGLNVNLVGLYVFFAVPLLGDYRGYICSSVPLFLCSGRKFSEDYRNFPQSSARAWNRHQDAENEVSSGG